MYLKMTCERCIVYYKYSKEMCVKFDIVNSFFVFSSPPPTPKLFDYKIPAPHYLFLRSKKIYAKYQCIKNIFNSKKKLRYKDASCIIINFLKLLACETKDVLTRCRQQPSQRVAGTKTSPALIYRCLTLRLL